MSFDIVVLRLPDSNGLVPCLEQVVEALPLGTHEEVRANCNAVFPGIAWSTERFGLLKSELGYAIEFSIPETPLPTSLHLCLFFGYTWEGPASVAFDKSIEDLYRKCRWQSFAASDSSSLLLAEDE